MILALYEREEELRCALHRMRKAGMVPLETYTPSPLTGESETSSIPLIILIAGIIGVAASLGLQAYSSVFAYPFNIGGRPRFSWISFVPTIFENAVLIAMLAGFAAYMIINGLPRLYDPVDEARIMRTASSDGWVLALRSSEPGMVQQARDILKGTSPLRIEELGT